jgi:hypothetical protein
LTRTRGPQGRCRSCFRSVLWYPRAEQGKGPICLDSTPRNDGRWMVQEGRAVYLSEQAAAAHVGPKYVAHFVTCPDAKKWRKGDRRAGADGRGDKAKDPGAMAEYIRAQAELLRRDPSPKAIAYISLSAAVQVLLELGVPAARLKETVDNLARTEAP